jgi:hypothetical protein
VLPHVFSFYTTTTANTAANINNTTNTNTTKGTLAPQKRPFVLCLPVLLRLPLAYFSLTNWKRWHRGEVPITAE